MSITRTNEMIVINAGDCEMFRVVMLESHLVHTGTLTETEGADLYILAGHEASY
jgi:hypothetical protein